MYRNASVIRRSDIRQPKASGMAPNPEKKKAAASQAASEQLLKKPATAKIAESSRGAEDYTRGAAIGWEGGQNKRSALIGQSVYKRQTSRWRAAEKRGTRDVCWFLCAGGGAGGNALRPGELRRLPQPPVRRRPGKAARLRLKSGGGSGVPAHPFLRNQPGAVGGRGAPSCGLETPRTCGLEGQTP